MSGDMMGPDGGTHYAIQPKSVNREDVKILVLNDHFQIRYRVLQLSLFCLFVCT